MVKVYVRECFHCRFSMQFSSPGSGSSYTNKYGSLRIRIRIRILHLSLSFSILDSVHYFLQEFTP
jgi:hypothetical protein